MPVEIKKMFEDFFKKKKMFAERIRRGKKKPEHIRALVIFNMLPSGGVSPLCC